MALDWDNFSNSLRFGSFNWDLGATHYQGSESKGFDEVVGDDILDRLPVDPFGMEKRSILTAAITGLIQDFEKDFAKFGKKDCNEKPSFQPLFKGLNWVWNGTIWFQSEKANFKINEISIPYGGFYGYGVENGWEKGGLEFHLDIGLQDYSGGCCDVDDGGAPHDALFFALGYLGVKDLLVVEGVCKSLRDAVRGDPLLWRRIHIAQPLSEKITDDALVKLTSRAQGTLQCLSLVECMRISKDGLQQVLESNPNLTKLSVPGCVRLSAEGILSNLRSFRSICSPGIQSLRIGGLFGLTNEQFEELKFLLGVDNQMHLRPRKPQYYRGRQLYISCDNDRPIDIEMCPKCQKPRLVYDCPAESCQEKREASQLCRACTICIPRCIHCGCCIKDCDYEETFCLNFLCLECLNQLLDSEEKPEVLDGSPPECSTSDQDMRNQFCLYG